MEKIIYSKDNYYRKKEYKITTQILLKGDKKFVVKKINNPLAKEHLNDIENNYKRMNVFNKKNINIRIADIIEKTDASLIFEFVEGETLEALLLNEVMINNGENIKKYLKLYEEIVDNLWREEFTLIDLNMDNIIIKNDNIYIIDYEWGSTDTELYNKDFLKYRGIMSFSVKNKKMQILELWCKKNNICLEQEKKYIEQSDSFAKDKALKILSKYSYLENYKKSAHALESEGQKNKFAQLYMDLGNGYSEESSKKIFFNQNYPEILEFNLFSSGLIKKLRFDPLNESCCVKILKIISEKDNKEKELKYRFSNELFKKENVAIFNNLDPQIEIILEDPQIDKLKIYVRYQEISSSIHMIEEERRRLEKKTYLVKKFIKFLMGKR